MSDDEERETKPFKFVTGREHLQLTDGGIIRCTSGMTDDKFIVAGYDARFPHQNQTKHCWQNYVDYHKCINAKGEEFAPCKQFFYAYRSLCPSAWTNRWDEQRDKGNFPADLNP